MMKKIALLAFVSVLLSTVVFVRFIKPVEAGETIYIRADGSVDPPTANIASLDNVTYTLTNNISDSIVVERDNIVVDGAGYTLQGTVANFSKGLDLSNRNNVTVKNMEIETFFFGIYLELSLNNTLFGNTIVSSRYGMFLYSSSNHNTIHGNIIRNYYFWTGIGLSSSSNNTISGNHITDNEYGITISDSSNHNTISGNNITNNINGINLFKSSNNKFCHNNFLDNIKHVYTYPYVHANFWDDGIEGNYWSNYAGSDSDNNGVGDSAYPIDGNNTDHYPLMGMFYDFPVEIEWEQIHHIHVISNSTVSASDDSLGLFWWLTSPNEYFQAGQPFIWFSATGEEGNIGFCRMMIPKVVLNDSYIVLVDGHEVPVTELPISNSTHTYLYFTYNHSTREVIVTIPEFPTWASMLLILILLTVAIAIYKRRLLKTLIH